MEETSIKTRGQGQRGPEEEVKAVLGLVSRLRALESHQGLWMTGALHSQLI